MRLDNQEYNFNFIKTGENIIRCSKVEEAFFNIFNITLDEQISFIKPADRYIDGHPIVKLNVEYGGILYEDVEFKVVSTNGDDPCVFLDEYTLDNGCIFESAEPIVATLEDQIELLAETVEVDWGQVKQQSKQINESKIASLIKQVEQQLSSRIDESLFAARQSILAESINIQNRTQNVIGSKFETNSNQLNESIAQWEHATEAKISNYIISAIDEARRAIEEQFEVVVQEQQQDSLEILSTKIAIIAVESKQAIADELQQIIEQQSNLLQETVANADENIKQHVIDKLNEFKQSIVEKNTESFDAGVVGFINTQTDWLQQFVEGKIANVQQSIEEAKSNLEQKQNSLANKLTEHTDEIVAAVSTKITEEAKILHQEQLQNVRQCVDQVISEQIAALQPTTEVIVTEARNTHKNIFKDAIGSIRTEMSSEMKAYVANLQQDLYKKFAIYAQSYAGGGSVAAQFADGGTMNGSLNVATGQILSGGIDISTLFGSGGGGSGAYLPLSGGTLTGVLSTTNVIYANGGNSDRWNSSYTIVNTNSATNWNYQGTDIKALTGNWQNTYSTVSSFSATWGRQTLSFNASNAQLTISDGNTVSLSALSGGNGSITGAYLPLSGGTVTGVLSTTNVIYASGGNSNQWNNTYSTVQSNSASWGGGGGGGLSALGIDYTRWQVVGLSSTAVYSITGANSSDSEAYRVTINAAIQDPVEYTVNGSADTITFSSNPPQNSDIIVIETIPQAVTLALEAGSSNVWIPAAQLVPRTTSGCGVNSRETTTYDQNFDTCVFDSVASEYADFTVVMPNNYDLGTIVAKFHWTAFTGSAGTVSWGIKGVSMTNDDSLDIDAGTPQTVSDTYILSGDEHVTDYTSAVTIAGTPQANERVQFTVYRDIIDTLGADAELIGIEIVYNGGGNSGSGIGGTMFRADASEFIPTTTAGCGVDSQESTTFKINRDYLTFSSTSDNSAMFWFNWPSGWNTAKTTFTWNAPTSAGSVVWSAAMRVFTDGESTDLALGTSQNVTDAVASANTVRQSAGTSGITPAGTIGAGKRTVLRVSRLASSDAADDMAAIAYLEGVLIEKAS